MITHKTHTISMDKGCSDFVEWYISNYSSKKSTIVNELLKRGIVVYMAEKNIDYKPQPPQPPQEPPLEETKEENHEPKQEASTNQLESA